MLVVDDDESLQNLFKVFLKKIGFSRVVVGTVKEALAALEKQHFDLLFLDLKLPDGPADDIYECAKEIDPTLPIVVITGYPDSAMLDRILGQRTRDRLEEAAQSRPTQTDGTDSRA